MRALVTGGTGFLGSFLVREWARRYGADAVVCLVPPQQNPTEKQTQDDFVREGICCVPGDLCRCPVADTGLEGPFDVVFHLAAATDTRWPESRLAPVNVQGTANLLETLKGQMRGKRVVFTSTSAAVDRLGRPRGPLTETSPCHPRTAYGRTKLAAEQLLRDWCGREGAEFTIARLTTLYGPGVRTGFIPALAEGLKQGRLPERIEWPGRVSLLFVEDATRCLLFLAECPQAANEVFFLSSGEAPQVGEIVRRLAHLVQAPKGTTRLPSWMWGLARSLAWAPGLTRLVPWRLLHILDDGLWCDNSKVHRLISFDFVTLDEGLPRALAPTTAELWPASLAAVAGSPSPVPERHI